MIRLSAALIGLVVVTIVVVWADPAEIGRRIASIPPAYVIVGLVIVQAQIVLSALRWRFTATRLGQVLQPGDAVRDYYLSSFLNQTLPGGVAGDAVRAVRRRGPEAGGWKVPALAVAMERASGQGVFAGLAGAGLIIWPLYGFGELPSDVSRLLTGIAVVAGCLGASILLLLTFPPKALYRRISSLKRATRTAFVDDGAWRVQSVLSLMVVGSYLGLYMLASAAVGAPLPYLAAITVIPLCLLMMLVPATVAGWGAREAAAALLWPLFGYSSSDGVAASIFYGALLLVGAVPGLAVAIHMLFSAGRAR